MKNNKMSSGLRACAGRPYYILLLSLMSLLLLAGCVNDATPTPTQSQEEATNTPQNVGLDQASESEAETATAVAHLESTSRTTVPTLTPTPSHTAIPTQSPTPTTTPTPHLTITPNAPGIISEVTYAQPPRPGGFSRPAANVPSIIKIVNQTSFTLFVTLEGVSNSTQVDANGSTEWQVVPGSYTYAIVAEQGGAVFLRENVTIGPGEVITITIDELLVSELLFINQTNLTLSINIPDANKTINLGAGQTSQAIPLPPGTYDFTATALSAAPFQDSITLEAGEKVEITLIASEIFGNSSVTLNNQTNFPVRLTVNSIGASVTAGAGGLSQRLFLPPGTYNYTVCDSSTGNICGEGSFTIESGSNIEVIVDSTVLGGSSSVRFENQTSYTIFIAINGVTSGVSIPSGTTSNAIELLPGTYTYNATSDNIAPLTDSFTVAADEELIISISLSNANYAVLTILNDTGCALTMNLTGPSTFSFTVPANTAREVNILNGSYTYSASACNASTSGSFSGSHEIRFFFE